MLNSAVEIIVITVSLLKIALRLDNSNRIGMIKGIEFSCHFLGRNQRILIMNLNWKLFRFCFIYRRRLITNVFHVRIINLETIITINRPRLRNQTLPKHRNLMCLIKFYRLCLFRSLLFHFVSLKKNVLLFCYFPVSRRWLLPCVCVCVCVCLFCWHRSSDWKTCTIRYLRHLAARWPWSMAFLPPAICHFDGDVTPSRDLPVISYHHSIVRRVPFLNHYRFLIQLTRRDRSIVEIVAIWSKNRNVGGFEVWRHTTLLHS